jgi:hypothetical protein
VILAWGKKGWVIRREPTPQVFKSAKLDVSHLTVVKARMHVGPYVVNTERLALAAIS